MRHPPFLYRQYPSIPKMLMSTVKRNPKKEAFRFFKGDKIESMSYKNYQDNAFAIAASLISNGVRENEHIAILSETRYEWCLADMGILCAHTASVTIFPTLDYEQVKFILEDSDSIGIFLSNANNFEKLIKIHQELPKLRFIITIEKLSDDLINQIRKSEHNENDRIQIFFLGDFIREGTQLLDSNKELVINRILNIQDNDLATIIYTSGTTGIPKGVLLSHRNFLSDAIMGALAVGLMEDERSTTYLPLAHSFAHTVEYIGACLKGATLCFAKNYNSLVENLKEFQPTSMIGVPYVFEQIHAKVMQTVEKLPPKQKKLFWNGIKCGTKVCDLEQNKKKVPICLKLKHYFYKKTVFSSLRKKLGGKLRRFISGGAPLNPEIAKFFYAAGVLILEGFGLTEAAPITHVNREPKNTKFRPANRIGTVGPPLGDDTRNPYPRIEQKLSPEGELLIRGPNVMLGYYKRPEETAEAIDKDGWLHTGDLAKIDEDGYVSIIGRAKQIIVLKTGKKIAPNLVEGIYKNSPYITQCMILGEGEKFISALIVPEFQQKKIILNKIGMEIDQEMNNEDFCKNKKVISFFEDELHKIEEGKLSHFETIKKFILIPEPFSEENGLLTPSLKKRREKIVKRYFSQITKIYSNK